MNINQNHYGQYGASYQGRQRVGCFRGYTKGNDNNTVNHKEAGTESEEPKSCREQIWEKMEEMAENIRKGTIQPKFKIGAQEYTIKEWEKLLEKFDAAQEAMQEAVQEHIAEVEKQAAEEAVRRAVENGTPVTGAMTHVSEEIAVKSDGDTSAESDAEMHVGVPVPNETEETASAAETSDMEEKEIGALLTDEITKCSYPTDDPKQKHWYITCYGQDGISCKEAYFDGTRWVNKDLWSISYTEKGQYEKVMTFLQRFPQDANLRFASHENFWKDFLAGEIDEDDFVAFFGTMKDGVPDYTYEKDGSTYIDKDKIKYAKYMNDFSARMYTAEEMELIQRAILQENRKGLEKLSDHDGALSISDEMDKHSGTEQEDDDLKTQMVTKPDGSVVLQITTSYGVMELEMKEAQKFGLLVDVKSDAGHPMRNITDLYRNNTGNIFPTK